MAERNAMRELSNSVCIVGVDESDEIGTLPHKSQLALHLEAITNAVRDAGLKITDVDGIFTAGQHSPALLGEALGVTPRYVDGTSVGGCSFMILVEHAVAALHHHLCNVAVISHGESGRSGVGVTRSRDTSISGQYEIPYGFGAAPTYFGLITTRHMHEYGTTLEQFAKVSVKNHKHSVHNPLSQYRVEVGLNDVVKGRMVAYPNTLYMCCPTGDGAAAAILVSAEKAKQLTSKPIKVACSVLTSDPYTERGLTMPDVNTLTKNAAKQAYEKAGLGPKDLDLVELHDCFATAELLHYENLGLCGEGEAGRMIDENRTAIGGDIPVNASGGLLSKGHPLGATGVANIYEVVTHLRGQAGARQVEGAKVGMAHVIGLGSACTIHILTA